MSGTNTYLMALDAGTGAGRCFLVSADGGQSFSTYQEWVYEYPPEAQPGGAEFDPAAFWDIFADLIRRALHENDIAPEQIAGISSTSQREGVVFLDREGRELYAGPNIDMRAPPDHEAFTEKYAERLHSISGHWPFPMFAPYRLLWFKAHKPEVYERIDTMLLLNDWILYRLCGERGVEPSNGLETLLLDIHTRDWACDLIDELGFPDIFPPVLASGSQLGQVTPEAAEATGLRPGTPVYMGGADSQCALLGMGAHQEGDIGVTLGTYGPVQMVLGRPLIVEPSFAWSGCHVVPGMWVLESTTFEAGQAFRWVRDIFYAAERGQYGGQAVYSLMERDATASPPGARGIKAFIGPRLPDYRYLDFSGPGGFVTRLPPAPSTANRGDFARATLEAVACAVRANVDRLCRLSGVEKIDMMRASGGLSQSRTLMQIIADMLSVPVRVPAFKEGSALGAAICAGVGSGQFAGFPEGIEALVQWDEVFEPIAEPSAFYQRHYRDWLARVPEMYGPRALTE